MNSFIHFQVISETFLFTIWKTLWQKGHTTPSFPYKVKFIFFNHPLIMVGGYVPVRMCLISSSILSVKPCGISRIFCNYTCIWMIRIIRCTVGISAEMMWYLLLAQHFRIWFRMLISFTLFISYDKYRYPFYMK